MRTIFCFLLLILSIRLLAQNEYNNCYFGETVGLNFNSNPPTILLNSAMNEFSQYTTFSDNSGNLLFYTNGNIVWNKNHQIMENGNINVGYFGSNMMIIPFTDNYSQFYIVSTVYDGNVDKYHLKYSIVDLSFNSGLGKISTKDLLIKSDVAYMLACIKKSNNHDYWLITKQGWNENNPTNFYVFSISDIGISTSYTSFLTTSVTQGNSITPSIDGTKIVLYSVMSGGGGQKQISIFDFNRTTGAFSNTISLNLTWVDNAINGILSPDNTKLYLYPYQYNMQAGSVSNILNSKIQVFPILPDQSGMQIMPDGKIYVFKSETNYLDLVNKPNQLGLLCNYTKNAINLLNHNCYGDYPKIIVPFVVNQLKILANHNCFTATTIFQISNCTNIQSVLWNYGDSQTSTELNPTHIYANPGTYTVTLTVTYTDNSTQTITKEVEIYYNPLIPTIQHD